MNYKGLCLLFLVISSCLANEEIMDTILKTFKKGSEKELFEVYHLLHEKNYSLDSEEGVRRFNIFKDNLRYIEEENSKPGKTYQLGIGPFTDMTNEEYASMLLSEEEYAAEEEAYTGESSGFLSYFDLHADEDEQMRMLKEIEYEDEDMDERKIRLARQAKNNKKDYHNSFKTDNLTAIDWEPYFTITKNQGHCGSCWAFSSTGAIEGHYNIQHKNQTLKAFSPQQLIDCSRYGCKGGSTVAAYYYIKENGIFEWDSYPYVAKRETCTYNEKLNENLFKANISGWRFCQNRCRTLDDWHNLLSVGPMNVGMDGASREVQHYRSGILQFQDSSCKHVNHAVVAAGYGQENGVTFVKVRNSWGSSWGEKGYFRFAYNSSSTTHNCYITGGGKIPLLIPDN